MTVEEQIADIKASMPMTYRAIQEKTRQIGNEAYALVRRGLKGEGGCFYAVERNRVVGVPPADRTMYRRLDELVGLYGYTFLVIWGGAAAVQPDMPTANVCTEGVAHGTH
jgi:hypothetical protein